ncbi:TATA-box-binding protein-like [Brevipalpus obovatus]|uniref:TATA-box-binding protein-like n=1 Tax=Brevipalpus obovatus TaxID=246614 RepID=UPI003D9DEDDD
MLKVVNIVSVSKVMVSPSFLSLPALLSLDKHKLRDKRPYLANLKTGRSMNQFSGSFLKLKAGTVTVFISGKVIFNGMKSSTDLTRLNDEFAAYLSKNLPCHVDFELDLPRIVNMTGCVDIGIPVDLHDFCKRDRRASYEPEIFPNLQYTFDSDKKIRGIVSKNGKIIITGATKQEELNFYARKLEREIKSK